MTPGRRLVQKTIRSGIASLCAADDELLVCCEIGWGIAPLLAVAERADTRANIALDWGDKLVGRAAALLFTLVHPRSVFAATMSVSGVDVLRAAGIPFAYDALVPCVLNRDGTGMCPMEAAISDVDDAHEALRMLERTVHAMSHTGRSDAPEEGAI